jgi:hypothetical protein
LRWQPAGADGALCQDSMIGLLWAALWVVTAIIEIGGAARGRHEAVKKDRSSRFVLRIGVIPAVIVVIGSPNIAPAAECTVMTISDQPVITSGPTGTYGTLFDDPPDRDRSWHRVAATGSVQERPYCAPIGLVLPATTPKRTPARGAGRPVPKLRCGPQTPGPPNVSTEQLAGFR